LNGIKKVSLSAIKWLSFGVEFIKTAKKLKASKKCGLAIKLFTEYQNEVIKIENLNMQLQSILLNR